MTDGVPGVPGILTPAGPWRNWGRTARAEPRFVARPRSIEEVAATVRFASVRGLPVKPVGTGHSFSEIAGTAGVQLDMSALTGVVAVDPASGTVGLGAGTTLREASALLGPLRLAFENLGDIDRQTISGATSTGTHGTGAAFGGLSTQIVALTLVTADGAVLRIDHRENSELLPAARVGLGALGVIVEVTIQCVPAFLLHAIERPEPFDEVLGSFEERATGVDHFEFYWFPHTETVLTKNNTRLPAGSPRRPLGRVRSWVDDDLLSNGALALCCTIGRMAPKATPPINRMATRLVGDREFADDSAAVFTSLRRVRFREMEYAIPREAVPDALRDVRNLIQRRGWRISFPIEVRVAAPDENWLSTAYRRESGYIAVHRHVRDDPIEYFQAIENVMRSYDGRPHWGKMHFQDAGSLAGLYPRFADFLAVRDRLDPDRLFANPYLARVLGP